MKKAGLIALVALTVLVWGMAARAQVTTAPPGPFEGFKSAGKDPIELSAARMEADLGANKIAFIGKVSAKQGDRTIYAERMDISFTAQGEITTLLATGSVKVRQKDSFATSDKLFLDNKARVIRLTGSPKVVQGSQIVTGSEIIYEIDKERIVVPNPRIEWRPEEGGPKTPKGSKP
jgi:lipopolysaccharide export system protein LptA